MISNLDSTAWIFIIQWKELRGRKSSRYVFKCTNSSNVSNDQDLSDYFASTISKHYCRRLWEYSQIHVQARTGKRAKAEGPGDRIETFLFEKSRREYKLDVFSGTRGGSSRTNMSQSIAKVVFDLGVSPINPFFLFAQPLTVILTRWRFQWKLVENGSDGDVVESQTGVTSTKLYRTRA